MLLRSQICRYEEEELENEERSKEKEGNDGTKVYVQHVNASTHYMLNQLA